MEDARRELYVRALALPGALIGARIATAVMPGPVRMISMWVHESGHAAFGLKDEYSGGGHGTSSNPHHNNYDSQASAETYNTDNGWPASDVELIQTGWWRPEPAALDCIMRNDGDAFMPDFERTCLSRILWFYSQL